jgi:hypothetical protein
MKASVAVLILTSLLAWTCVPGLAADKSPTESKDSTPAQKDGKSEGLFSDTRKYLSENAAKSAENVRHSASRLKNRFSSEPAPAPVPKAKKARSKKAVKAEALRARKLKPHG